MIYPADVIAGAQAAGRTRVAKAPFPSSILAQWRLESNAGKSISGTNNFFGIQATEAQQKAGQATARWTQEFRNGKYVKVVEWFANYQTAQAGIEAHTALLMTPHYADCQNAQTTEDYCRALKKDGYATAPTYDQVLISIIEGDNLKQYDTLPAPAKASPVAAAPALVASPQAIGAMQAKVGQLTNSPAHISAWEKIKAAFEEIGL